MYNILQLIFLIQQINLAHLVPPLVVFLAKNPAVSDYDISSLRRVLCGAAPLGQDVTEACLERHPGIESLNQGVLDSCVILKVIEKN